MIIRNSDFGAVSLAGCLRGTCENNGPCRVRAWPGNGVQNLCIDGKTVTHSAGIITIPYAAMNYNLETFLRAIWTGALCDIIRVQGGSQNSTGGTVRINSITDDETNIYLGVSESSLTAVAATVKLGGSGYAVNDKITLKNGVIMTVAGVGSGAITEVAVAQPYADSRAAIAVSQAITSGHGSGATFNLRFGIGNGTLITPPNVLEYSASGNRQGDTGGLTADDAVLGGRIVPGFINGDIDALIGNTRHGIIAPQTGTSYANLNQLCRGRLKLIRVKVLRPYTGSQFSPNSLFLIIQQTAPADERLANQVINLSKAGERRITAAAVSGMQPGDVLNGGNAFFSAYNVLIQHGNGIATMNDSSKLLPIVEIKISLEDVTHEGPE